MKLPEGLLYGRVKGGHRIHVLAQGKRTALCGHKPGEAKKSWRMKDRTGWWGYGRELPAGRWSICTECLANVRGEAPAGEPARRPRIALLELQAQEEDPALPRLPTRVLTHPWPFPESVLADRGLVRNVGPVLRTRRASP